MGNRILFLFVGVFLLMGCNNKSLSPDEQLEKDIKEIREYISTHNLSAKETESGLFYVVNKEGTGKRPNSEDNVTVRYKGYTTNGDVFDKSDEDGISFKLQNVIKGWTEGLQKFKEGGKGILLIPSELGYGKQGSGPIQPNTVLIFDIELLTIVE